MEKLTNDQMENLVGGVSRAEYCMTLANLWNSGGWHGGMTLFASTWTEHCGNHGFDFEAVV